MLVKLPYGACVDPEVVKYIHVRIDRPKGATGPMAFTVVMKTEEDQPIVLATFDEHGPAVALSSLCGKLVNAAGGEGDEDDEDDEEEDDDDDEDDDEEVPAAAKKPVIEGPDDEEW